MAKQPFTDLFSSKLTILNKNLKKLQITYKFEFQYKFRIKFKFKLKYKIRIELKFDFKYKIKTKFEFKFKYKIKVKLEFKLKLEVCPHAYTKGGSCDSALSCFVNDVERTIHNGQHLLAVSLDCSGDFDNIRFEGERRCMESQKIPYIIRWYRNLLKSRSVLAQVQGLEKTIKPSRVSPQGGVLSPLVWNITLDSFLSQYKKGPVKALGYADDILLYIAGSDINVMEEFLQ